jgi:hypothetical protein
VHGLHDDGGWEELGIGGELGTVVFFRGEDGFELVAKEKGPTAFS